MSEEFSYRVKGFSAGGRIWRVNEMASVDDAYQGIARDLLISRVTFREEAATRETELTVISPEAFDKGPVGGRRTNKAGKSKPSGALDGTAKPL